MTQFDTDFIVRMLLILELNVFIADGESLTGCNLPQVRHRQYSLPSLAILF